MSPVLSFRDEFAVLTLDRPEVLNALNYDVLKRLDGLLDEIAASKARALVVTGAGTKAFSAGADLKEIQARSLIENQAAIGYGQGVISRIERLPIASVAVINGYAFGGGLELALACTFRIATPNARMGLPEIKLGLIPGYGGTQRLPRVIGEARALEMVMTGRAVDAVEAERIGLVSRIVEGDPVEAGMAFARAFTCYGLPALRYARDSVLRSLDVPIAEGLKIESAMNALGFATEDGKEGVAAFIEKRPARFQDR